MSNVAMPEIQAAEDESQDLIELQMPRSVTQNVSSASDETTRLMQKRLEREREREKELRKA